MWKGFSCEKLCHAVSSSGIEIGGECQLARSACQLDAWGAGFKWVDAIPSLQCSAHKADALLKTFPLASGNWRMLGCTELWQPGGALCSSHDGFGGFERLIVLGCGLCFPAEVQQTLPFHWDVWLTESDGEPPGLTLLWKYKVFVMLNWKISSSPASSSWPLVASYTAAFEYFFVRTNF